MSFLGNIIWLLFGGLCIAIEYFISSILLCLTIVGIPFGLQTMKLAGLALWPFGKEVISHPQSNGCLSTIMNILWILIGGFWISVSHILFGIVLAITIIGIPFAKQHFKLAGLALVPFGKDIRNKK